MRKIFGIQHLNIYVAKNIANQKEEGKIYEVFVLSYYFVNFSYLFLGSCQSFFKKVHKKF